MKKFRGFWICLFLVTSCFHFGVGQEVELPDFPGDRKGAQDLLTYILNASLEDQVALTKELRPLMEDCEAIFEDPFAKRIYKYQKKLTRQTRIVIRPLLQDQTEYLLWSATTEELIDYQGEAKFFPGGYKELASYMKPGVTFYRFKFIQPGRKLGSAYDLLVYINGEWRMIHRAWSVLFE